MPPESIALLPPQPLQPPVSGVQISRFAWGSAGERYPVLHGEIMTFQRIATALILCAVSAAQAEFQTPIAITNAKIITSPGKVIDSGTIVIDHGRITAVGPSVDIPANAQHIDVGGAIVYPGLIDAASTAGISTADAPAEDRARIDDENPDVRDGPQAATVKAYRRLVHPHWRTEELIDPDGLKRDQARRNGFTTALIAPRPAIFGGNSAIVEMGDLPLRRSLLRTTFAQHAAFITGNETPDLPPMGPRPERQPEYPTTTMGAIAAFRQILLDAQWQRDLLAWADRNPKGERPPIDRDLEALLPLLDKKQSVVFIANSENEILRALNLANEFNLKPIIAGGREAWKCIERLKKDDVPVIVSLKWSQEPKRADQTDEAKAATTQEALPNDDRLIAVFGEKWQQQPWEPQRQFDERTRLWGDEVDNLKKLSDAGIRVAVGSFEMDALPDVSKNLRSAFKRGLTEDAALAALTKNAAAILGLDADLGEIAPGKLANLIVLTKPITDEKAKVRLAFVEGKPFDTLGTGRDDDEKGKGKWKGRNGGPPSPPPPAASTPATTSTSQPTDWPDYRVEIEADRKPALQTGGNLLIKNANVLTVTQGDQPETDLLISNGKIEKLGKNLVAPPNTKTIDLRGYYVIPGIIDPHSHMCSDGGLNEFALSITSEVRVRDVIDHKDLGAYRALAGGVTAIHTMHGSANAMGGQNATLRLKFGKPAADFLFKEAPRSVKFALGENVKQSNFGRRGSRFPNSRMGVEAVMRRAFDAAREYRRDQKRFSDEKAAGKDPRPVRKDLRLEALADIMDGAIWVHCHCYRADEILRLLAVAEDAGFRIAVLQHVLEGYRIIPEILRHGCGASTFSDWWGYKLEAYDAIPQNAARLEQGHVVTTVNSDSAEMIRHLNLEAAKSLHFGGLPANEALKLCTLNGAIQLGVDKYVGSIELGKFADLAIFNGHPLDTTARNVMTLIDGECYFQDPVLNLDAPPTPRPAHGFAKLQIPPDFSNSGQNGILFSNATIFPVTGQPIEHGSLLVQNGMVASLSAKSQAGVTTIDATGLRIYPGLINAATDLGLTEIDSVPGSVDVTDIGRFEPDLCSDSAFNTFASAIEVTRAEGITHALIVPGGGFIPGRASLMRLTGWSMPEAIVESSVGLCMRLPSLPPDLHLMKDEPRKRVREDFEKSITEIDAFMQRANAYAAASAAAKSNAALAPDFDRQLDAMLPFIRGEKPVLMHANSFKEIREALRFCELFKLKPILVGARDSWKLADELAAKKIDVIFGRVQLYPGADSEPWDAVYRAPGVLARAGVRFCFGTENSDLAKLLGVEAGMAVAHGLDEDRAIRALTLDAAQILGVADRLGSIEVSKPANLIICTDSPLQADNAVIAEFIDGRQVDLTSKHTRTDDKFRARPTSTLPPAKDLRGPPAIRVTAPPA